MDYVKDGTLTIQARTIKEVNSIDRVVVYADGCQREYLMPLPEERKEGEWEYVHKLFRSHTYVTGFYVCGVCHTGTARREGDRPPNFCPNCGARMGGVE